MICGRQDLPAPQLPRPLQRLPTDAAKYSAAGCVYVSASICVCAFAGVHVRVHVRVFKSGASPQCNYLNDSSRCAAFTRTLHSHAVHAHASSYQTAPSTAWGHLSVHHLQLLLRLICVYVINSTTTTQHAQNAPCNKALPSGELRGEEERVCATRGNGDDLDACQRRDYTRQTFVLACPHHWCPTVQQVLNPPSATTTFAHNSIIAFAFDYGSLCGRQRNGQSPGERVAWRICPLARKLWLHWI